MSEQDRAASLLQRVWRWYVFNQSIKKSLKNYRQRINVVSELITSEEKYVNYLKIMQSLYVEPLRESAKSKKPILTTGEISSMFGNISQLLFLAQELLFQLKETRTDTKKELSKVFAYYLPFMKLYSDYVKNYDNAVALLLERYKKDKIFQTFIKNAKSNPSSRGLELRELISKPFQRIFAYNNIFKRLLELTPEESQSWRPINSLLSQMQDIVNFINMAKKQSDSAQKLKKRINNENSSSTHERLQKYMLRRWRKYVSEGRLNVSMSDKKETWEECFLANDVFLLIRKKDIIPFFLCFSKLTLLGEDGDTSKLLHIHTLEADNLTIILDSFPNSCRIKFSEISEKHQWVEDFKASFAMEAKYAKEHNIANPMEVLDAVLQISEEVPHQYLVLKDMYLNLQIQVPLETTEPQMEIDWKAEIQSTVKEGIDRIQASVKELVIKMETTLQDQIKILLRNDEEAFNTHFSHYFQRVDEYNNPPTTPATITIESPKNAASPPRPRSNTLNNQILLMLKHVNENRMMTSPQGNGDGDVYAFGINRNGELGMKDKAPKVTPQLVSSNMKKRIVSVSAGLNYSVALTTKGTMYAWGVNEFGNLGVKDTKNRNVPTRVRGLKNKKVWKISAGACHCLAVTEQGELYSWGRNACGELGLKDVVNRAKPTLVDSFGGKKVMNVMAGFDFSVCVTEDGMIYAWGGNAHGQCCAGDLKNRNQARKISCSGKVIPAKIVIGGQHGLMLTDKGHVYSWGRNQCGQLGVGGFADTANMVLLPVLQTKQVTSVYAGANFSVALTENGLYTWGGNHYGQLGLGDKSNRFIPALLVAMKSIPVERVFASSSAYHMFILDKEDRLHALGPNNFGQLGIENEESTPIIDDTDNYRELPEEVDFMRGRHVTSMALAQNHTITLVTNQLCSSPQKR